MKHEGAIALLQRKIEVAEKNAARSADELAEAKKTVIDLDLKHEGDLRYIEALKSAIYDLEKAGK